MYIHQVAAPLPECVAVNLCGCPAELASWGIPLLIMKVHNGGGVLISNTRL